MEIEFTKTAKVDLKYWQKTGNIRVQKRIEELLNSILENPFEGIGKPEKLKYKLTGKWSRRIDLENRFVYAIENNTIFVYSLKGHYL